MSHCIACTSRLQGLLLPASGRYRDSDCQPDALGTDVRASEVSA
jgi:hypothetical protein